MNYRKIESNDIDYLNCNMEKLSNSSPVFDKDILLKYYNYNVERKNIYIKKTIDKSPYPWTEDNIINDNRFTNVKRYLDKTSKYLIDNISNNKNLSFADRVWRTILFRLYNKIETAELINLSDIVFWDEFKVSENMDKIDSLYEDPFNRAYKIILIKYAYRTISPKGDKYWKSSILYYISRLYIKYNGLVPEELMKDANTANNWLINQFKGVGPFIAYQIWCDLCYIDEYPMSTNYFTDCGPGCIAGLNMIFKDKDELSNTELLFYLRDHIDIIFKEIDTKYDVDEFFNFLPEMERYWDLQDIENSMCELSKYIYISEGRHKKPRKYIHNEETI